MLRRHRQLRKQVHRTVDLGLFAISLWLAHLLRDSISLNALVGMVPGIGSNLSRKLAEPILPFHEYLWLYVVILPFVLVTLEAQGFYQRPLFFSRRQTIWPLLRTSVLVTLTTVLAIFLVKDQTTVARSVAILFGAISFALVYLKEELVNWTYQSKLGQAQVKTRLLLVGSREDTCRLRQELAAKAGTGIEIAAELDLNESSIDHLLHLLHEHSINGVIINAKHTFFGEVEKAIQACELEGVEAWLVADFFKTQISRTSIDDFYGRPVLVFHSGPEASWQGVAKHLVDFVGALALLVCFSIPMLLAAVLIKLTSRGPILFRQLRSGLNGQPFVMYKFRSMETDAEQRKQELALFNEMSGPVFKMTNDPRITPIGKWLRKFSVDEFPQLFNVLKGEMSLVGPRPLPVEEVKRFDDFAHRRRLSVKPGLTCLWQIQGRNEVTNFKDWVRLDLEYIDNWSIWLDLEILCRTVPIVLFAKGAK
jgi:exopolysaccharide biosynthesis polyprenyl glycosylphosphotransferase